VAPRQDGRTAVEAYIAKVPPPFRRALESLRATIRAAAPDAEEVISYGLPAFRQDGPLVYYAAFRDHLSFFPGGPETRRKFAKELAPFGGGKGTVRFTLEHPLPKGLVRRIVLARLEENAARRSERAARKSAPRRRAPA
jgi:uncharacterized protein YdhG (YjbR/CyaY superfamily)